MEIEDMEPRPDLKLFDSGGGSQYLKPADVAKLLSVSADTVTGWIHSGALTASNIGQGKERGRYRIAVAALEKFMAARQIGKPAARQPRNRRPSYQRDFAEIPQPNVVAASA
jgi:excisionase family DNA binding protein